MSQENVEFVRRAYALLDQGDAAVWELISPEFVLDFSRRLIDPVVLRGREQVRAWSEGEAAEAWEGGRTGWQPLELIDAGDRVLAFIRSSGRGRASGIEIEADVWNVWTFRDGKLAGWTYFGEDQAAAREAVGLSESAIARQNVEIVKAAIDAVNREDWDAAFQDAAPGFELDMSRGLGLMKGVYGLDQVRPLLAEFARHWEAVWIELHEFIEAGDLLVVPQTTHGEGRDGIEVVSRPTLVWTIRDGAIERISMYQERQDALEAVGLSE